MEWYIPITILPGVGFLILSTSNFLISLNEEIKALKNEKYSLIITQKLEQLRRLNYSLIGQFISSFLFVLGGLSGEILENSIYIHFFVFTGVLILAISIVLLIVYSIKSLKIRTEHLKI